MSDNLKALWALVGDDRSDAGKKDLGKPGKPDKATPPDRALELFTLPDVISEGGRNNTLTSYAGYLKDKGLTDKAVAECVRGANWRCKPPLSSSEIESIIKSSLKFEGRADKFDHEALAEALIIGYHMTFIDGAPAVWDGKRYRMGERAVYSTMLSMRRGLKQQNCRETMFYLTVKNPHSEMAPPRYIAFENGVLDIETLDLIKSSPRLIIPNVIPHNWNSDAVCSELDEALDAWACGVPERSTVLKEIAGLSMYRGRDLATCPILIGEGSNGKSTYMNLLHNMLGDENVSSQDIATIGERFQTLPLIGKLANIGDDISNDFVNGSKLSVVKKIVTGDWTSAEYKGGATFSFRPYCTLIFSCNEMPRLGDSTKGIFRRFLPVPFEATFSRDLGNINTHLSHALSTDAASERLAYLGVMALRDCIERGGPTLTQDSLEMLNDIRLANSSVYQYVTEELGFNTENAVSIDGKTTQSVYSDYVEFCRNTGCKYVSRNTFTTEICKLYGMESRKTWISTSEGQCQLRCFRTIGKP